MEDEIFRTFSLAAIHLLRAWSEEPVRSFMSRIAALMITRVVIVGDFLIARRWKSDLVIFFNRFFVCISGRPVYIPPLHFPLFPFLFIWFLFFARRLSLKCGRGSKKKKKMWRGSCVVINVRHYPVQLLLLYFLKRQKKKNTTLGTGTEIVCLCLVLQSTHSGQYNLDSIQSGESTHTHTHFSISHPVVCPISLQHTTTRI